MAKANNCSSEKESSMGHTLNLSLNELVVGEGDLPLLDTLIPNFECKFFK